MRYTRQRPAAAKLNRSQQKRLLGGGSKGETEYWKQYFKNWAFFDRDFGSKPRTCFTWDSRSLSGLSSAKSEVGEPVRFGDPDRWRFLDFGELDRDPLLLMLLGDRINAILSKKSSLKEPTRRANLLTPIRGLGLLQSLVFESSANGQN